jgi:hypothetical protein
MRPSLDAVRRAAKMQQGAPVSAPHRRTAVAPRCAPAAPQNVPSLKKPRMSFCASPVPMHFRQPTTFLPLQLGHASARPTTTPSSTVNTPEPLHSPHGTCPRPAHTWHSSSAAQVRGGGAVARAAGTAAAAAAAAATPASKKARRDGRAPLAPRLGQDSRAETGAANAVVEPAAGIGSTLDTFRCEDPLPPLALHSAAAPAAAGTVRPPACPRLACDSSP